MHKIAFCFLLMLGIASRNYAQVVTPTAIIHRSVEACKKVHQVSCNSTLILKSFDAKDTIKLNGRLNLEKSTINNSGLLGKMSYNGNQTILVGKKEKRYVSNNRTEIDTINYKNGFEGNIHTNLFNLALFKNNPFSSALSKGTKLSFIDTLGQYYRIRIVLPSEKDFDMNVTEVNISKESFLPLVSENTVRYKPENSFQYRKVTISNLSINDDSAQYYLNQMAKATVDSVFYTQPFKMPEPLERGTVAPAITITNLNGDTISLEAFAGKKVILDCWYIGCYPCQKSIPMLQKLQKKYSNKLVVIGLNPIDDNEKISAFAQKRKLNYLVAKTTTIDLKSKYHVVFYPTLYLIDEQGKVISGHFGFPDDDKGQNEFYEELAKLIEN